MLSLILFYCLCCPHTASYLQASMLGPAFLWKDLFKLMFIFESPVQATLCLGGPPSAPAPAHPLPPGALSSTRLEAPVGRTSSRSPLNPRPQARQGACSGSSETSRGVKGTLLRVTGHSRAQPSSPGWMLRASVRPSRDSLLALFTYSLEFSLSPSRTSARPPRLESRPFESRIPLKCLHTPSEPPTSP